jgi:hypothetical protein
MYSLTRTLWHLKLMIIELNKTGFKSQRTVQYAVPFTRIDDYNTRSVVITENVRGPTL